MNFWNLTGLPQGILNFPQGARFESTYRCYSVAMMGKEKLENGGKIILPASALDVLARLNIEYPMLFELSGSQGRVTHCGVLEFVADEGLCYLPHWMMQQLLLTEGQLINVKSATLPKGTYTKLQPVDETFLDLTNPKAVLENALRNWSALTAGDVIIINYNKKNYEINVLEVKPDTPSHAISIIEADVMVDFAPSEDQLKKAEQARRQQLEKAAVSSIKGKGKATEKEAPGAKPAEPEPEVPKPSFPGSGFRLDGRSISATSSTPYSSSSSSSSSTSSSASKPVVRPTTSSSSSSSSAPSLSAAKPAADSTRKPGGLVFGAGNTAAAAASAKANAPAASKDQGKKKEEEKKPAPQEEKKFVPFSGAGYSLRG